MRRSAFTLFETLVVIGIIVVLVSILSPVMAKARRAGQITGTKGNLRQIYLGLMLYREENDSKVEFGDPVEMGLPVGMASSSAYLSVVKSKAVWRSPCCCHKEAPSGHPSYVGYFMDYADYFTDPDSWKNLLDNLQGAAPMVADMHCNDSDASLMAPEDPITVVGVRLNGQIQTRRRSISIAHALKLWRD